MTPRAARGTPCTTARYVFSIARSLRALEGQVGRVVLRSYDHARGVFVEPMDYSRPDLPAYARKVATMGKERVYQRPRPVPRGRVNHKAPWLVDDDDVAVLI